MWQQKFEVRNCTGFYEALTLLWDTIDKLCDTPTSKKDCCLATSSITNVFGLRTRIFLRQPLTVENPDLGVTLDLRYWYWHCLHTTFLQMWNINLTQKMWRWKNSINVHCHIFPLSCWDVNCSLSWYVTSKKTGYSKAGSGVKSTVSLRVRIQ